MFLIAASGVDKDDTSQGRNELPAAKELARSFLESGYSDVTIWKRIAICELETKMVFKGTNGVPMEPEII